MIEDPFAPLVGTSDNAAYVALPRWTRFDAGPETTEDDVDALDDVLLAAEQAGGSGDRSGGAEGGSPLGRDVPETGPRPPRSEEDDRMRERVHDEPVRAILPTSVLAERDRALEAEQARADGGVVPLEADDDRATVALKGRLARLHLRASDEGMHERALGVLDEIMSGDVRVQTVTKKGDVVTTDLHPRFRASAAKAVLATASAAAKTSGKTEIANANILAAGDLIAQVDPAKLRAAVARLRGEVG